MKAVPISLNLIQISSASQSRASTDQETIKEYESAWRSGADFPPVDIFQQGCIYSPGDGIHRILSAKLAGKVAILAYVFRGDERDAFLHGCTSNQMHGLRRTNADKRHMVTRMLNDKDWVKWSDRRIAEHCRVSVQFVSNVRHELSRVDSSPAFLQRNRPRLGADGKVRRQPTSNATDRKQSASNDMRTTDLNGCWTAIRRAKSEASLPGIRNGDLDPQPSRRAVLELLNRLEEQLIVSGMYEQCCNDVKALRKKIKQLSLTGVSR